MKRVKRCFGCSRTHLLNLNIKVRSSQHAFTELVVCICVGLAKIVLMLLRLRGGKIWFHHLQTVQKNIFTTIIPTDTLPYFF